MKTISKLICSAAMLIGLISGANAQSDATANATAVLLEPLQITKSADLHFGTLAASATPGTVTFSGYTAGTRTASGGVTLVGGSPSIAKFDVTGEGTSLIDIAYPSSITLTGPGADMTVDNIEADQGTSANLSGGLLTILVRGRLNVAAAQASGTYTNTTDLTVTVSYN